MDNKRGQELSTSTIILLILAVIILVILIIGFTMGWDKIAPWIKKDNNIDTIAQQCELACLTNNKADFCTTERDISDGGDNSQEKKSCDVLSKDAFFKSYIDECDTINCPASE